MFAQGIPDEDRSIHFLPLCRGIGRLQKLFI
jgi:hypothetical protein